MLLKLEKNLGMLSENVLSFIQKHHKQRINLMYTIIQKNISVSIHKIQTGGVSAWPIVNLLLPRLVVFLGPVYVQNLWPTILIVIRVVRVTGNSAQVQETLSWLTLFVWCRPSKRELLVIRTIWSVRHSSVGVQCYRRGPIARSPASQVLTA